MAYSSRGSGSVCGLVAAPGRFRALDGVRVDNDSGMAALASRMLDVSCEPTNVRAVLSVSTPIGFVSVHR